MCLGMRSRSLLASTGLAFAVAVLSTMLPGVGPARAAPKAPARAAAEPPKSIGKFEDWQAATHAEGGQTICYAFTRAKASTPSVPGRGGVVLTVTQRPGARDVVALSAGFAYAAGAEVKVQVDKTELAFYTGGRSAFALDGPAAVAAFTKGTEAVAKSPDPRGEISDTFGLHGFTAAYAAVNKACPAK